MRSPNGNYTYHTQPYQEDQLHYPKVIKRDRLRALEADRGCRGCLLDDAFLSVCNRAVVLSSARLAVDSTVSHYFSRRIQGNRAHQNILVYFFITPRCRRSMYRTTRSNLRRLPPRLARSFVCPCPLVYAVICMLSYHIGCHVELC